MLNSIRVGNFIMSKRKSFGMTQQQLADKLGISFYALSGNSTAESGSKYPQLATVCTGRYPIEEKLK